MPLVTNYTENCSTWRCSLFFFGGDTTGCGFFGRPQTWWGVFRGGPKRRVDEMMKESRTEDEKR